MNLIHLFPDSLISNGVETGPGFRGRLSAKFILLKVYA